MRWVVALVGLAAGCGRLNFDDLPPQDGNPGDGANGLVLSEPADNDQVGPTVRVKGSCIVANGDVSISGTGGGPVIEVAPSTTLAFGQVAYFAGANPPSFQSRTLGVKNAGTKPVPANADYNLRLGKIVNGFPGQTPYFGVVASQEGWP